MKHDGGRVKRECEEDERSTVNRYEFSIREIITGITTNNKERNEKGGDSHRLFTSSSDASGKRWNI